MKSVSERSRWSISGLSAFTATLIALPSLSVDVVMPGLMAMRSETGATMLQSGLVITLFMFGLAIGQACLGPLSDSVGRRPVLLAGLGLYVISGACCAFVSTPSILLTFRATQGIGAGAATVLSLAIVRDLVDGETARVVRSYAFAAFNVVPILAPSVGALTLGVLGWKSAYVVPAAMGAMLMTWVFLHFEETFPMSSRGEPGRRYDWSGLLSRKFLGYVSLNAASYASLMAYIAGSSLMLMDDMGLSAEAYAIVFAGTSVALMFGAWANGCLTRFGASVPVLLALGFLIGNLSSFLLAAIPIRLDLITGLLIMLNVASRGLIGPNAQQAALEHNPNSAGAAAGLLSLAQVLSGAAASVVVIPLYRTFGSHGLAYLIAACSLTASTAWLCAYRPASKTAGLRPRRLPDQ